jgi:membrane protein DedA with SNARE-associated domain
MENLFAETDKLFEIVSGHSLIWIYLFVLASMTVENFFPPYPGDVALFVCGVYAAGGNASWTLLYIVALIGTMTSVMILYSLGRSRGRAILASNKIKWLGVKRLDKLERWFARWGDKVLLASRYITGVRALLALFAGIGNVRPSHMFIYSLISAASYNFLILSLAVMIRRNWQLIDRILGTYNLVMLIALAVAVIAFIIVRRRRRAQRAK